MNLNIDLPEISDPGSLRKAERAGLEAVLLELYSLGEVSAGRAAELLDMTLSGFLTAASRKGLAVVDLEPERLDEEVDRALKARSRSR